MGKFVFVWLSGILLTSYAQDGDPVLDFYVTSAGEAVQTDYRMFDYASFSFTAVSRLEHLGRKGEVSGVDSARVIYYYSGLSPDSHSVEHSTTSKLENLQLEFPNVFLDDYHFYFYPNDTGGAQLAVGFDTDSLLDPRPVGMAIIDRESYQPVRLYLSFDSRPGYKRLSRFYSYSEQSGLRFPDSLVEHAAIAGIFTTEHYRMTVVIEDLRLTQSF